jgi:methionyl-tRNA formyltransferase
VRRFIAAFFLFPEGDAPAKKAALKRRTPKKRKAAMRLVMMGTGTFAEPTFEALLRSGHEVVGLVTQPEHAGGSVRGSTRRAEPGMKLLAERHRVPVFQPENVNTTEGVAGVQAFRPDLLVVAAYGQILSRDVLAVPPFGGINVHASLLPKYRGAAPIAWAIYHGETQTGVTIIKMSVSLDAGDMLAQEAIDIGPEETAGEVEARLAPLGAKLALQVIEQIAAGTTRGIPQDKSQASKAPKLKKEHGQIDWTRDAREVCNHIRAMQPWPTAFTFFHQEGKSPVRVIITRTSPVGPFSAFPIQPGSLSSPGQHLWVAAGSNCFVDVLELQPAGKKRMTAVEFLRGHPIKERDRFGPETP